VSGVVGLGKRKKIKGASGSAYAFRSMPFSKIMSPTEAQNIWKLLKPDATLLP
jgi:hypothetical protein